MEYTLARRMTVASRNEERLNLGKSNQSFGKATCRCYGCNYQVDVTVLGGEGSRETWGRSLSVCLSRAHRAHDWRQSSEKPETFRLFPVSSEPVYCAPLWQLCNNLLHKPPVGKRLGNLGKLPARRKSSAAWKRQRTPWPDHGNRKPGIRRAFLSKVRV